MITPHGGNIYRFAEALGIAESELMDFSASINPLGVPESVRKAINAAVPMLVNYPDPDTRALRLRIAEAAGADPERILCGNGSTELIYLAARALRPSWVLIPAPTFSEYEQACRRIPGASIAFHMLRREQNFDLDPDSFIRDMEEGVRHSSGAALAFLCNPNNPTGRLLRREQLLRIAEAAAALKCTLVVDEAFIDFCPEHSILDAAGQNPFLVVIRSLTKIYALSGLRIGYAVLSPALVPRLLQEKEPWSVNSLAQVAAAAALRDAEYLSRSLEVVAEEKRFLETGLGELGIAWLPSAVNYYLLQLTQARDLAAALTRKGILVRSCENFRGLDASHLRIAVKSRNENQRLLGEIGAWPG